MEISFTLDLPPVPECFSKLLVSESKSSALPDQPWREAEKLRELKDVVLKSLAEESVPDSPPMVNGESDDEHSEEEIDGENEANKMDTRSDTEESVPTPVNSAFSRLNTSLSRLKREMVNLRHMDMSLFCQLLSLNEAINDFKMSVTEGGSEYTGSEYTCSEFTGSEYSFGGMGSRAGSLSSLIEESEWSRSLGDDCDTSDQQSPGVPDGLAASTSSLLQQIKALTLRAETDF